MNGVLIFAKTMWKQILSYTILGMLFGVYHGLIATTILTLLTLGIWELAKWCRYQAYQNHGERFIWISMSFVLRLILCVWLLSLLWPLVPMALDSTGVGNESRERLVTIYLYASAITVGWLALRLRWRLFRVGWQMRQEMWNRYILAFFKTIALDQVGYQRHFYSDEAPPIWLSHAQQSKVRKYISITLISASIVGLLMAWLEYKILVGVFSGYSLGDGGPNLIFALSIGFMLLSIFTRLFWSVRQLYQMVWLQGGATFFSPWEEKLVE